MKKEVDEDNELDKGGEKERNVKKIKKRRMRRIIVKLVYVPWSNHRFETYDKSFKTCFSPQSCILKS